jgi:putative PIN family toxin of toxin-antitoxin system
MVMRVVFDTNIIVSALLFSKGQLSWLREVWSQNQATPLISEVTEAEIRRVLAYPKFKLSNAEQKVLLGEYLPFCERITIPNPPPSVPECRDPKDVSFLLLAVAGGAAYLVTGDQDLLSLADEFPIPIVRAEALQEILTSRQ